MSLFLCCVSAPFKLALLNWIPLVKYYFFKKSQDASQPALSYEHIKKGKARSRKLGKSGLLLGSYEEALNWDQFRYILK